MARRPVRDAQEDEDETPPWMERAPKPSRAAPAAAEPGHTLISWRALIIGAVVALIAAIGLVIGVRRLSTPASTVTADGQPPLIRAPAGPYKTRVSPDASATPDALAAGTDDPIATLAGAPDPETPQRPTTPAPRDLIPSHGPVDATADAPANAAPLDETPGVAAPARAPRAEPQAVPVEATAAPRAKPKPPIDASAAAPRPKPKPAAKPARKADTAQNATVSEADAPMPDATNMPAKPHATAVQLGAFSTREKAEAAWDQAIAAHPELARLHRSIAPVERAGQTLYRLRATGAAAAKLCTMLSGAACVTP
jgi:hypothetical protein